MTTLKREKLLELAKEAGFHQKDSAGTPYFECWTEVLERFAALLSAQVEPTYLYWCQTLIKSMKRLSFAAQTAYGTAGPDAELMAAIAEAERAMSMAACSDAIDKAEPPKPISEQNARFAIDGAIAFGRMGHNKPPEDAHWLMPYWEIGRQLAAQPATPISSATESSDRALPALRWISVDERLPEGHWSDSVLTFNEHHGVETRTITTVLSLVRIDKAKGESCLITHWMPLPDGPSQPASNPSEVAVATGNDAVEFAIQPKAQDEQEAIKWICDLQLDVAWNGCNLTVSKLDPESGKSIKFHASSASGCGETMMLRALNKLIKSEGGCALVALSGAPVSGDSRDAARYRFVKTMPKEAILFWLGAYGRSDAAIDAAMQTKEQG